MKDEVMQAVSLPPITPKIAFVLSRLLTEGAHEIWCVTGRESDLELSLTWSKVFELYGFGLVSEQFITNHDGFAREILEQRGEINHNVYVANGNEVISIIASEGGFRS